MLQSLLAAPTRTLHRRQEIRPRILRRRQENQRLRHETHRYRQRISELLGDQIDGTDAHSQGVRVQELTDQNAALSRQAGEANQLVHQLQQQLAALSTDLDAAHTVNRSLMAELNRSKNPVRRPGL